MTPETTAEKAPDMTPEVTGRMTSDATRTASGARTRVRCAIGVGGNQGDPEGMIELAWRRLAGLGRPLARSPIYETEPVGPPQPAYLNAVFLLDTTLEPRALLRRLQEIEDELGDDWDDEPRLVKETRAYEKAVAEAAGSLETETEARDRSEDSDALVSGTGVAEDDSSGSGSWLRSEGDERSAKEVVKELLKSSPIDDDDDDDDDDEDRSDSTRLTRFQRLMLTLKARQSSRR